MSGRCGSYFKVQRFNRVVVFRMVLAYSRAYAVHIFIDQLSAAAPALPRSVMHGWLSRPTEVQRVAWAGLSYQPPCLLACPT